MIQENNLFMKIYLLIVSLLFAQSLAYRYLNTQRLQIPSVPQAIFYVAPNVFVAQQGKTIYLYDTATNTIQQTSQSNADNPRLQVAGQMNLVLFKNNSAIYQLQPHDGPVVLNQLEPTNQFVYPLGLANKTIIYHSLDPIIADRWITYIEYLNQDQYLVLTYNFTNPDQNILRGSGVQMISPSEYYFVSGGICMPQNEVLFFFKGSKDEINNVFNLSIPGCNMPNITKKQTIGFVSADVGNQYRHHVVTFKLNAQSDPFLFTTQVLYQFNGDIQEWISFTTFKLIGIDYIGTNLYSADEELCRILQHQPDAYKKAQGYLSVLPAIVTDTAISYQNFQIAVFSNTSDFQVFRYEEGTGKISLFKNVNGPNTSTFKDGEYYGGNLWTVRDSTTSNISTVYLSPDGSIANIKNMQYPVVDYCSTKNQILYSVQFDGNRYKLNHDQITYIGDPSSLSRTIQTTFSIFLPGSVKSVECLDNNTIVIFPINQGESITTYQSNGTNFAQTGRLTKNSSLHSEIHVTPQSIIFLNSNKTSMLVYSYNLKLVSNSAQPFLPPGAAYDIISTVENNIIFAISGRADFTQPDSLDHYTLVGSNLSYAGSYPLYGQSEVNFKKIIILPHIGRLSIDYGSQSASYEINYPPQSLRGYFYDVVDQDCRGYNFAKFKLSNIPDTYDMIVINSINTSPIIQRYTFTQTATGLLPKAASSTLNNYIYSQMSMQLSADRQKVLVCGIKQAQTNLRTIQVKNSNNLDTLFQKEFFNITTNSQLQAYGLYNSDLVSVVQYQMQFISAKFNLLDLNIDIASQGKISTDSNIVAVDIFATCSKCSYIAVAAQKSKLIQLLSLKTNTNRRNITASCNVIWLALSADGSRVAYYCQDYRMYVYDAIADQSYLLASNYTQVTNIYFVSRDRIVLINDGTVYQVQVNLSQTSKLMDNSKVLYQSLASVPVQTIAINSNLQIYAFISDSQTVSILDNQGNLRGVFVFDDPSQTLVSIAFDPMNQLIVTTNINNLITLSPTDCPSNTTINGNTGYCACKPTFSLVDGTCACLSNQIIDKSTGQCGCKPTFALVDDTCACLSNQIIDESTGQCGCKPTLALVDGTCACLSNATINDSTGNCTCKPTFALVDGNCACEDGSFYDVTKIQCGSCNVMCNTCQGDGVSNCVKYSALFIIIIVVAVLLVVGLIILLYFKSKKGETKLQSIKRSASNKKKSMSSDALAERLVYKDEEEKMRVEI